jgi:hypothetical protein
VPKPVAGRKALTVLRELRVSGERHAPRVVGDEGVD